MTDQDTRTAAWTDAAATLGALVADWYQRFLEQPGAQEESPVQLLQSLHGIIVMRFCESRGLEVPEHLLAIASAPEPAVNLREQFRRARIKYGDVFAAHPRVPGNCQKLLPEFLRALYSPRATHLFASVQVEVIGQAYEQSLASAEQTKIKKKSSGIYYTPVEVADGLVEQTLGRLCEELPLEQLDTLRVLDPACGAGVFLVRAYERLLHEHLIRWVRQPAVRRRARTFRTDGQWHLSWEERKRILQQSIHGVDQDEYALEVAKLCLFLKSMESGRSPRQGTQLPLFAQCQSVSLTQNLKCADSLLGHEFAPSVEGRQSPCDEGIRRLDWATEFTAVRNGGFHVVLGNPPWGQKQIDADDAMKRHLHQQFPSSRGIFDWFRPFVELGIRLTRAGGYFGMVLPDIVLLKNYESTRRLLLDELAITKIEWLGAAFAGATIDAVTIAGRRAQADANHQINVVVRDPASPLEHRLRQSDFYENPRCTFNLFLTEDRRRTLLPLRALPRLGDFFEVHEGIHSGNIRSELFVTEVQDSTCRELLFGRDELRPYSLRWTGNYIRLSALPKRRTRTCYANLGKMEWHEASKILVRRTGDRVTAAVDENARFVSNNFFLLLPRTEHPLNLDGACALLNSYFMTWYFQAVEPRKGRAFAELKIKHLVDFPFPSLKQDELCRALNDLGTRRRSLAIHAPREQVGPALRVIDDDIDRVVLEIFSVKETDIGANHEEEAKKMSHRRTA